MLLSMFVLRKYDYSMKKYDCFLVEDHLSYEKDIFLSVFFSSLQQKYVYTHTRVCVCVFVLQAFESITPTMSTFPPDSFDNSHVIIHQNMVEHILVVSF